MIVVFNSINKKNKKIPKFFWLIEKLKEILHY
jgi:hypothetical protein